ncbi:MAG TPA: ankyrin repeat domain-containing protein [Candidatus Lokiarchaeia archaeon]|nr:ankyrin repeat domain-containing protein [Candidatus Lokiarchaeia archaeon]
MNPIDEELLNAIGENDIDGVKKAVENGADLGMTDCTGDTPLHVACAKGLLDIARYLVERGADILVNDVVDMTPVHLAAREGHDEVLAYLLDSIHEIPDHVIDDIILVASQFPRGKNASSDLFAQYRKRLSRPEDSCDLDLYARLVTAASQGDVNGVNAAIDIGSDLDARDESGWTALMEACIKGQSDVVKALLNAGASVNAHTSISGTAIIFAAAGGYTDIVDMLLEQGADPEVRLAGNGADAGLDAIACARRHGHKEVIELLQDWEKKHH